MKINIGNLWILAFWVLAMTGCIGDDIIFDTVLEQITIKNPIDTLAYGTEYQFEATFFNNVGLEEGRNISWESSDTNTVSISDEGLAKGVDEGMATITATVMGEIGEITNSFILTVGANTTVALIERTGTIMTTSSYLLEGSFVLKEDDDGKLVLEIAEDYRASSALPGLYLYMTNNPNSVNGALEIGPVDIFTGAHSYTMPEEVELNTYNHLLYYCKPFRVKVGDGTFDN